MNDTTFLYGSYHSYLIWIGRGGEILHQFYKLYAQVLMKVMFDGEESHLGLLSNKSEHTSIRISIVQS